MQWLAFIIFRLAFFALGATGLVDICGGWFITPFAIFGWVLLFLAIEGWCHSRDLAKAACGLFDKPATAPQPVTPVPPVTPADPAPQQLSPVAESVADGTAYTLATLALMKHEIDVKRNEFATAFSVVEQQNLVKQAAANAEAKTLKDMKQVQPNAA